MGSTAILTYHSIESSGSVVSVTPQDFVDQMACLAEAGYQGISLREALSHRASHGTWPENAVVLTFDDGYANTHGVALPTLTRYGYTATVFVISGHMGARNDWAAPPTGLGPRAMLTWQQLAELSSCGIEIAAHTKTHPDLQRCSAAEVEEEIVGSRLDIEERLGIPVHCFAYPFGSVGRIAQQVVAREFHAACTTILKRIENEPLHKLPRVDMYYIRSHKHLLSLLNGQLDRYLSIRRWGRSVHSVSVSDSIRQLRRRRKMGRPHE